MGGGEGKKKKSGGAFRRITFPVPRRERGKGELGPVKTKRELYPAQQYLIREKGEGGEARILGKALISWRFISCWGWFNICSAGKRKKRKKRKDRSLASHA